MRATSIRELGPPVPEWLTTSETYGFGSVPWQYIKASKWRFVTHVPHTPEYLGRLRASGMRGFPYMTFYQTWITQPHQGARASEHTDWLEIDEHGHWKRTGFWESEDAKNMYCTCANTAGYRESVLAYLESLMKLGAGGIFLDNVHINRQCWGEKYGVHKHLYPTQIEAFAALLKEAQALIRSYDPQGALLINSADPVTLPKEYWPWIDCEMSESYICTWVSTERWGDWAGQWNGMDRRLRKWVRAGKQVCCLSYVGHTHNPLKDDAYFCYASARLMNMIWQGGSAKLYEDPSCSILYQIETGQPVTAERVSDEGVHYRIFADGMVAVNPTDSPARLQITHAWPASLLNDLYSGERAPVSWISGKRGTVTLDLPAQSGRVYLCEPTREHYVQPGVASDAEAAREFTLTIETDPPLGKARFRVDEVPLWTHSGRWTTEYVMGADYGKCAINFDEPGKHRVEALDIEKRALLVADSYGDAIAVDEQAEEDAGALSPGESPRLGRLMDPSNPTQFLEGEGYRFVGWGGASRSASPAVEISVNRPVRLIARYEKI